MSDVISFAVFRYTVAHCLISPELYAGAPIDIALDMSCFALDSLVDGVDDVLIFKKVLGRDG